MTHFLFWCPQLYFRNGWSEICQILYAGGIYISNASLGLADYPLVGVVRVTWFVWLNFALIISLELVKLGTSNVVCWFMQRCTSAWMIDYRRKGSVKGHVTSLSFGKWVIISRKRCKIESWLQRKSNRKLYVAYQMSPLPMPLNVTFAFWNFSKSHTSWNCNSTNLLT